MLETRLPLTSPGVQGDWDNVRLDSAAAAVPEPGTLPLMGAALLVLVGVVRNRRVRGDLFGHAVTGISKGRSQRKT
jgi:PEP-CTERM motif-containing protein